MGVKVREKPAGSDTWWVMIDHDGRRKAKKVGTGKKGRELAEEVARKIGAKLILKEFDLGDPDENPATFADYSTVWINTVVPASCKPSTVSDYKGCLEKHVEPVFGRRPVAEITRMDVKTFLARKSRDGYAKDSLKRMRNVLSGPLSMAVDDRKIGENPAQRLGRGAILPSN
jgi:integrase